MIPSAGVFHGSASAGLTDSLRAFVVKLSHSWLPIGVRERRCSATTDPARNVTKSRLFPIYTASQAPAPWRHRFLIHLHGHLKETDTAADIRCTISKGRTGFLPETRMILTALKQSPNSGWFQVQRIRPRRLDFKARELLSPPTSRTKYSTGEQWTKNSRKRTKRHRQLSVTVGGVHKQI
jgi:hypothetical protein